MVMKSYYDELKLSMEKVRCRNAESDKYSLLSMGASQRQKHTEERQSEDLAKLDLLIRQLSERWNNSLHFYRTRYLMNTPNNQSEFVNNYLSFKSSQFKGVPKGV